MGIFGAFLAIGWLGGNLIKDTSTKAKITPAMNRGLGDRIEWRNGKYYDTKTGQRVVMDFFNDPVTGRNNSLIWVKPRTGFIVYNPHREEFYAKQEEAKKEIERLKAEKDVIWLQEAIDNNKRFAKVILPFKDGVCEAVEGYIDRLQKISDETDRNYYIKSNRYGVGERLFKAIIEKGHWIEYSGTSYYTFDKYDEAVQIRKYYERMAEKYPDDDRYTK